MIKIKNFDTLKKEVDKKSSELAEAKGKLSAILKSAKDEFGTDDIDKLSEKEKELRKKKEELEEKREELENEINELLEEIEEE